MKIGILSMQEVKNYGSFLQAFSLKKNIEELGHECDFINIVPGKQIGEYKQKRFHKLSLLIERLWGWDFLKRFVTIYKFQSRFSKEFHPYLGVRKGKTDGHYDVVVIGSDEVFNCSQKTWFGYTQQLYGEGLDADKMNVDPVLIYDYSQYMPEKKKRSNYIIVYSYPGRISDKNEIATIQAFAKKKGLPLISIGHYFSWCDDVVVPNPFEVLALFRDAAYIVTDTFHGSVFSIKYNKQFCTIVRDMNNQKLTYLLKQFGLEDRIVKDLAMMTIIMDNSIDYQQVNRIIEDEKKRSLEYIHNELR